MTRKHVEGIWSLGSSDSRPLEYLSLSGSDPVLPSSFAVGTAAQASMAAAALAAAEIRRIRGRPMQGVSVDMLHATVECATYYKINGEIAGGWDRLMGLYKCGDGSWIRIHTNFEHHRDGVLKLLGLPPGPDTNRDDVQAALADWTAIQFETAASNQGCVVAAVRTFSEWDGLEQAKVIANLPLVEFIRIGDAPTRKLPPLATTASPLTGIRVLELTRILAGPVGGRALAAYGADVLLVNSPKLPNISAISETSRGKLSALLDLKTPIGKTSLRELLSSTHVFMQGYRPGGIAALGFGSDEVAEISPGSIYVSLSAYGSDGPWMQRRGFDSLVQSAMGFNDAEGMAAQSASPKAFPVQILDHATGLLMAFGAQMALLRQQNEGGSWNVRVSLAQTGHWLRGLGRVPGGLEVQKADFNEYLERSDSGFGVLEAVPHSAQFSETPAKWVRPSVPPGTNPAQWPT